MHKRQLFIKNLKLAFIIILLKSFYCFAQIFFNLLSLISVVHLELCSIRLLGVLSVGVLSLGVLSLGVLTGAVL